MVEENESLAFTHARLRKIFQISYSLDLAVLPDFISDNYILKVTPVKLNDIRLSIKRGEEPRPVSDFTQIVSEKLNSEKELPAIIEKSDGNDEQVAKGMTLIKPLIVKFLHTLFLKSDKHLAEQFSVYTDRFVEFVKSEINRIERIPDDIKPSQETVDYIFGTLIPLLSDYVNKILVDSIDEGRDRKDNEILQQYAQTICNKYSYLAYGCTKKQIEAFKEFFGLYFDENNIVNNTIMEKVNEALNAAEKNRPRLGSGTSVISKSRDQVKEKELKIDGTGVDYNEYWKAFLDHFKNSKVLKEVIKLLFLFI